MELTFRAVPLNQDPAASLAGAMRAEMSELYEGLDIDEATMPKAGAAELGPPAGTFLVGFDADGQPVYCGGVKRPDTGPRQPGAERMYREAGYRQIENFNANPVASFLGEQGL